MMQEQPELCFECEGISLEALLDCIPKPSRPDGCGVPNFFEFSIPKPLSFTWIRDTKDMCKLCALISSQRESDRSNSSDTLELAALCPPSEDTGNTSTMYDNKVGGFVSHYTGNRPEWYDFKGGEIRVNSLEPITQKSGSRGKFEEDSPRPPWQINVAADEGSKAGQYITRRPLVKQGSEEYYHGLLRMIDQCNSSHPSCRLGVSGVPLEELPVLPTRVIDVGTSERLPRLVHPYGQKARYVTLSHCWGAERWVATTTRSLPQMLESFDLTDLPQTYIDAITVARVLGVRYLWIDSFCIIQDDRNDWEAESQKMGDIYEKAYLNIAATGAKDGKIGFLGSREDSTYVRVSQEDQSDFYFTNQPDSSFDASVNHVRLNSRGWVVQERLLSRRTIHFAADMWYWECGKCIISEDGWQHNSSPKDSRVRSLRDFLEGTVATIGKIFDERDTTSKDPKESAHVRKEVLWAQILRAYSRCDLSVASDKLPALQGLANNFQTSIPYHYGHWISTRESVLPSLMWCSTDDGGLSFPEHDRAPTWSCLKGDGPVDFYDTRGSTPCTMVDRIEGDLSSLQLRGRVRMGNVALPNGDGLASEPTLYSLSFKNVTQYGTFTNTLGPARFDDASDIPKELTLLLTHEHLPRPKYVGEKKDQLALVLREVDGVRSFGPSEGNATKTYRRIGIAHVNAHSFFNGVPFSSLIIT